MSRLSYVLALVVATGGCGSAHGVFMNRATTPQCLRFMHPIGYSASGALEKGDTAWYVLQLRDSGKVDRPLFPRLQRDRWAQSSRWTSTGDTLRISVFDGLVGWDISMWRARQGFAGVASYLSDAAPATGLVAPRMNIEAVEIACPADSARVLSATRVRVDFLDAKPRLSKELYSDPNSRKVAGAFKAE